MSFCPKCGYELRWRTLEGRRVLFGCACEYGDYGLSYFLRDRAAPTRCPKCGDAVFFVRHNGGSVWFDQLGDPWLRHACFDDEGRANPDSPQSANAEPRPASRAAQGPKAESRLVVSVLDFDVTDLGQRILYISIDNLAPAILPAPGFWLHDPLPQIGGHVVLERERLIIGFLQNQTEYRYWPIDVTRCDTCGQLCLNRVFHRQLCKSSKRSPWSDFWDE